MPSPVVARAGFFGAPWVVVGDEGERFDDGWEDLDYLMRLAEDGDVKAMSRLATRLAPSDIEQAIVWDRRAAELGFLPSMYNLGVRLQSSDLEAAKQWWTKAAQAGHRNAMCALGWAWNGVWEVESRRWYLRAAEDGSSEAMSALGHKLLDIDPKAARRWLELAAQAGQPDAMADMTCGRWSRARSSVMPKHGWRRLPSLDTPGRITNWRSETSNETRGVCGPTRPCSKKPAGVSNGLFITAASPQCTNSAICCISMILRPRSCLSLRQPSTATLDRQP
jgi:TPR repeat protein